MQISQVFLNLISNALKYSRAEVRPVILVEAARQAGEWIVSVADNGIGIPEAEKERFFRPFERANPSGIAGVGLGLSIVQQIVTRHGGRIWCHSRVGEGTTFFFTLPTPIS